MDDTTETEQGDARPQPPDGGNIGVRLERIVRTLAEMEQGRRPVGSLDTLSSPLAARRIRKVVHGARISAAGGARRRRTTPCVRSVTWTHPSAGVTEGLVLLDDGIRTRPYCVRLEQEGDCWRIVELAPPDAGLKAAVTEASRTGRIAVDEGGDGHERGPETDPPVTLDEPGITDAQKE